MSRSLSFNVVPAPAAQRRTAKLPLDYIPWNNSQFILKQDSPDTVVLTSVNSSVDTPCEITFGRQTVKNVYSTTGISLSNQAANATGVKTLVKLNSTFSITDSVDASYRVDVPFAATLTVLTGTDPLITDDAVKTMITYLVSALFNDATATADVTSNRISALRRGSLIPTQL